jgi:hypothetical protein
MYQSTKHNSTTLQENVMNKKQMVLAALMIFATANLSQAQTFYPVLKKFSTAEKERVDKVYAAALSSGHNGLIESALAVVTKVKLDLPADKFPMIKNEIENLVADGGTPVIRSKALLASIVFANPAIFKKEAAHQYSDPNALFNALADRTTETILSSN